MCQKKVPGNLELCDEHRSILSSIHNAYNQDPEMRRRWDSIIELIRIKGYGVTDNADVEEVFKFIDEIKTEFENSSL
jgi:hypothetical protein